MKKKWWLIGCIGLPLAMIFGLASCAGCISYISSMPQVKQAREEREAKEAAQLKEERRKATLKEKQKAATASQFDSVIKDFQKNGYLSELDCELSTAQVNPAMWHAADLKTKEKSTFIMMKYCALKGGPETVFTVKSMMDGKELGGFGLMGFTVK